MCAVDSGIVAIAIGMIASSDVIENVGRLKAGTAKGPTLQREFSASSGIERKRLKSAPPIA